MGTPHWCTTKTIGFTREKEQMFKGAKYWRKKAQKNHDRAFDAMLERELAMALLRRLIQTLEIDGFGHVKGINTGDATQIYHEYLDDFITKN
jgi:hypothetical protein